MQKKKKKHICENKYPLCATKHAHSGHHNKDCTIGLLIKNRRIFSAMLSVQNASHNYLDGWLGIIN